MSAATPPERGPQPWGIATAFAALAVAALAIAAARTLIGISLTAEGLPTWDMAAHGFAGVEVARAVRDHDVPGFLAALDKQVTWPFVHSLMLVPFFVVLGDGYSTGGVLSACLYAGTVVASFAAGLALHPRRGPWIGAAAASLALLSPAYRIYGTLTMLEMPGVFLLAVCVALWAWSTREGAPRGSLAAAGIASATLFFCKYNYGLMWLAALGLHEGWGLAPERRAAAWAWLRAVNWRRPFTLFMLAYLLALVAIMLTGGGVFTAFGRRVVLRSPGNLAYVFYLGLLGRLAVAALRDRGRTARAWAALPPRLRLLFQTIVLPLALWFVLPYRVKEFVGYVINRRSLGLGPLDGLIFYPRAFLADYSPNAAVGLAALFLALIPPRTGSPRDAGRLLYLAMWVGLLATAFHPFRESRFLFTTALLVWLRAAHTLAAGLEAALERVAVRGALREALWGAALVGLLAWAALGAPAAAGTRAEHQRRLTSTRLQPALEALAEEAAARGPGAYLLGYWDRLSPALLAWHGAQRRATHAGAGVVPDRLPWAPAEPDSVTIAERVQTLRRKTRKVIVALPKPGSPFFTQAPPSELRGDRLTAAALARDPAWVVLASRDVPEAGYRIVTYGYAPDR